MLNYHDGLGSDGFGFVVKPMAILRNLKPILHNGSPKYFYRNLGYEGWFMSFGIPLISLLPSIYSFGMVIFLFKNSVNLFFILSRTEKFLHNWCFEVVNPPTHEPNAT